MEKNILGLILVQILMLFSIILGVLFIILKIVHVITWSWLLVACPFIVAAGLVMIYLVVFAIIIIVRLVKK